MMRSDHLIIIICLLLIWKLTTRTTGAAQPTPPDDNEPKTEQPPLPFPERAHVTNLADHIQQAQGA